MMLTDDNFASIVAPVEEGRGVFEKIKKYLMFLLSTNLGEITLMMGSSVLGLPLPLSGANPIRELGFRWSAWIGAGRGSARGRLMRRRPRDPRTGIFTPPVIALMLIGGIWSAIVNLSLFNWALNSGRVLAEAMTMAFGFLSSDSVRQSLQLPLGSAFTSKTAICQQVAEFGNCMGTAAACGCHLCALSPGTVRYIWPPFD